METRNAKLRHMLFKNITFIILLFCSGLTYSQNIRTYDIEKQAEHARLKKYDSTYRVNYFENIIIKVFSTTNINRLRIQSFGGQENFNLEPQGEYFLGLSLDYKWFGVSLSYTPEFLIRENDRGLSNDAKSISASLNFFYSDRWRQEFKYTYIKSFSNNSDSNLTSSADFSNTQLNLFRGSTFFIANPNFSYRSYYAQLERQLKSTGSLIPRLMYSYAYTKPNIIFDNPQSVVIDKIESFDIIAQIGYMYTFVVNKKWYATLGLHGGVGYNYSKYHLMDTDDTSFNSNYLTIETDAAIGYNSYRWFFGLNGNLRNFNDNNNDSNNSVADFVFLGIHFGYRFNDNKPMRKFFGWFEDHLGF